jgi:hypothetical protein
MKRYILRCAVCLVFVTECGICNTDKIFIISGELKKWHKVTLTFTGPETSEDANTNPFRDYRLDVTFQKSDKRYVVPGYYAADGNAGQTSASAGNKWRVHFVPDEAGQWAWTASFWKGPDIAISDDTKAGLQLAFDDAEGSFTVGPTDKTGRDHRAKGLLKYVGKRYLQFAETGEYFLKGGADSPENFLAYADFDGTFDTAELKREGEAAGEKFLFYPLQYRWRRRQRRLALDKSR